MPYKSNNKYGPVHVSQYTPSRDSSVTYSERSPWSSDAALSKTGSIVVPKPRENRQGKVVIVSQYDNEVYGPGEPSRRDMVQAKDVSGRRRA